MPQKKEAVFHGNTDEELIGYPLAVKERFVQDLEQILYGRPPNSRSKSMKGLGSGVRELIKNGHPAYRLVYVVKGDYVHILHVFSKTSSGTDSKHEKVIKARYKSIS